MTVWAGEPLTVFTHDVINEAHRRHSSASTKDLCDYAFSTWMGCGQEPKYAYEYLAASCDECGLSPLDNKEGFGWCGGTWKTLIKVTGNNRRWIKDNPWDANQALAERFTTIVKLHGLKTALMCWNQGGRWKTNKTAYKKAMDYVRVVCYIGRRWSNKYSGGKDVQ